MIRARFGIRLGGFFPNAAIFVKTIPAKQFNEIAVAFDKLRSVMALTGFADVAAKMVFEDSAKK